MAKKQTKKDDIEKLSFEQAIETLTEIVDKIESGQVSLAESLQQYEKGMRLIKRCRGILLDAEKRIEEIAEDDAGDEPEEEAQEDNDEEADDDALF